MSVLWTCSECGAANLPRATVCEHCGQERGGAAASKAATWKTCAQCGDESNSTNTFHDDGAPEDRGRRLCPACWIPALRRRGERAPISTSERAAAVAQVRATIARIRVVSPPREPVEVRL